MIIELYGSPGAGKTFLKNNIVKKLSISGGLNKKNPIVVFIKKMVVFLPASLKIKKELLNSFGVTGKPIYNDIKIQSCINNIVMVVFGYKHSKNKLLFMDEGVIHRLISLSINYNIKPKKLVKSIEFILQYIGDISVFYLYEKQEDCYKSIKERNRHDCNIDELDDEKLKQYLSDYEYYCDYVCRSFKHITINRNDYTQLRGIINDKFCSTSLPSH